MATNINKTNDSVYWYGGTQPEFMWPNGNCPILHIKHIPLPEPKLTHKASDAISAPTSGGASSSAMMSSGWESTIITTAMIDPNAIVLPDYGVIYEVKLVRQYDEYALVEDSLSGSNSDDWTTNYKEQYPCKYQYIALLAYPTDLWGTTSTALVKSSMAEVEVELKPVACNQDMTVWVLDTDYFLPLEPEAYTTLMNEPNEPVMKDRWSDPNDGPVGDVPLHYLPVDDTDEVTVQFTGVKDVFKWWLCNNPSADLNGDGIFNMKDWAEIFNY
jgi:hypothetical protein